jgi:hypothetical protein
MIRNSYKIMAGKRSDHSEDLDIDGLKIMKWMLRKLGYGLVSSGSRQRQVVGFCECGSEPSVFKRTEFSDKLSYCQLLKICTPWS